LPIDGQQAGQLAQRPKPFRLVRAAAVGWANVGNVLVNCGLQRSLDRATSLSAQFGFNGMTPCGGFQLGVKYGRLWSMASQAHARLVLAVALDDGGHFGDIFGTVP
jgi:hypothetical protein